MTGGKVSSVDYIEDLDNEVESKGEGHGESEFENFLDSLETGYLEFEKEVGVFAACLLHFNLES